MEPQMREHARRSSGVYDQHPFATAAGSQEGFADQGEPPAGVPYDPGNVGAPAAGTAAATQPKTPWYKTRKFIICQIITLILVIVLIFVLLFPVVRAIAQLVVKRSNLGIDSAQIENPQNGTFQLNMKGTVTNTGIFNAKITFTEPINVAWVRDENNRSNDLPLGSFMLKDPLNAKHKRATLDQKAQFIIDPPENFGEFTSALITQPEFKWHLQSNNLRVNALKFPVAKGIKFDKDITIKGINNFDGNVRLVDFQLPRDAAGGGIEFSATTELNNPSPFDVDLGLATFALSYKGLFLGQGQSQQSRITPGNNSITLNGVLVPQSGSANLSTIGELFSNYLNSEPNTIVVAQGLSTRQASGEEISWLSQGLKSLKLNVPFVPATPVNPIQAIDIGFLNLTFTPETAYAPVTASDSVFAALKLPFGFGLNISQIANSFAIMQNNQIIANLSTNFGDSSSDIDVLGPKDTQGSINITLNNSPLKVPDDGHARFAEFNKGLTDSDESTFFLVGQANANSELAIGSVNLNPIKFNVPSKLKGLGGLKGSTTINSVDVVGGTSDHIQLAIGVTIQNPSSLNLQTGDLNLQLLRNGSPIGTTLLPNLTLAMGTNKLAATGAFQPNLNSDGRQTLNDFVGGNDVDITIAGFDDSTKVQSLLDAFKSLNIGAKLPALKSQLLDTASLEILPTTGHGNTIAHVKVALANPFTSGLTITAINSTVMSHGLALGTINTETNFPAKGKATTESPTLDLDMNLDPPTIFTLLRRLAVQSGEDTRQIDKIVELGGIQYVASTDADSGKIESKEKRQAEIFKGFDLPSFVDKAFAQLQSDIELTSAVTIGDYPTSLQLTQKSVPVKTDESLHMLLPLLAQPIVQKIITGSVLGIDTVLIKNPQENSFETTLKGSITNAGPFDAEIDFGPGLTISFANQPLGTIEMPKVKVAGDVGAQLDVTATFHVADVNRLTDFTKVLLTEEDFTWDITGSNLTVNALGISVPGVALTTKSVKLKGMNGLKGGVKIDSFDLPNNDPAGGVHLTLQTTITNPSQVGVELDSIGFNNFVGSTLLGPAASTEGFTLAPQSTFKLPLVGRLIKQDSDSGLATVSQVFTDFIHGKDTNVNVVGASAGPSVSWLNNAIKSLQIETVLPAQGKLQVIKSISLQQMELDFTPDTAYRPATSSNAATAAFQIPFGFPIDIVALEQNITASVNGQSFATLNIPKGPSKTDVDSRVIHLTFDDVPFAVFGDKHPVFQQFLLETTKSKSETFRLSGAANTDASTAIGVLNLRDIEFDVETTIAGLQNLNAKPAIVSNLDVNHGFPDFLLIKVTTGLNNPSNLTIGTGDVSFALNFKDATIGSANIGNLTITPGDGNYSTDVHFAPQGSAKATGQVLLENFLQGIDSGTVITGTSSTTKVDSLIPALEQITLNANIPALHQNLITATHIVFPPNIVQTGIAATTVDLANPFTASINLLTIQATATFGNITLGTVPRVDASAHPVHADGHSNITTPTLPLKFNLEPTAIIQLLSIRAAQKHIDVGPLAQLFQIALTHPDAGKSIVATPNLNGTTCNSGKQFDVNSAILNALEGLQVTLDVQSTTKLDDFQTDLSFKQFNVPAITDKTALFLIGAVAPPVVQVLVDGSTLSFDIANITNISDEGFDLSLKGKLLGTGPLDALITFVEPVNVNWQGKDIATIALPPVCAEANVGVPNYETKGRLTITDLNAFTEFATFLLHNPSFDWTISTNKLRLTALGTDFDNVSLSKKVTFKAFNGLPGVTISNFQLPKDDPAGGITISTDSDIPSPAQLGIQLGTVTFNSFFKDVQLGPLSGSGLFLAAGGVTKTHLDGRIVPQSGDALNTVGELFSNFLAGKNQTLTVKGNTVDPNGNGQTVTWLSTAFKTLSLDVILPGHIFEIIHSIDIQDLELELDDKSEDFAPKTSSKTTLATFSNPFGFSLQVIEAGQDLTINFNGQDAAALNLPKAPTTSGVSTGNVADLVLSFSNQTLKSLNNDAFGAFFAKVTDTKSADVVLKGAADVVGKTAIGNVPISGIPFNVKSSIGGINSFNGQATLSNVSIAGSGGAGGNQFIRSPLMTTLQNPSNISLKTTDISLPVFFKDVEIGRATIDEFDLVPGQNTIPSEFHYMPADANDTTAQSFISSFLTSNDDLALTIKGDSDSSPFGSLVPALEGVSLSGSLHGNGVALITHVHVIITLDSLVTNLVTIDFDVFNPTSAPLVIKFVQSNGMVDGTTFAFFRQDFDSFVIPPFQTANSGPVPNVLLTQGALASLDIIPLGMLDIGAAQTVTVGEGGYEIPWLQIFQTGVPTQYDLSLGLGALSLAKIPLPSIKGMVSSMISEKHGATESGSSTAASAEASATKSASAPEAKTTAAEAESKPAVSSEAKPTPAATSKEDSSSAQAPASSAAAPGSSAPAAKVSPAAATASVTNEKSTSNNSSDTQAA